MRASSSKYRTYFDTNNARAGGIKKPLDPAPRVVLVPGLGLFGLGRSRKDARVAADLAEAAIETIADAEAIGRFESLPEPDLFDMEYWSLEQAKLSAAKPLPLAGQIVAVTGAGSGIGAATAKAFAAAGAEVALLDVNEAAAKEKAKTIGGAAILLRCHGRDLGRQRLRSRRRNLRRPRHSRVQRGRDAAAGQDRRHRRGRARTKASS